MNRVGLCLFAVLATAATSVAADPPKAAKPAPSGDALALAGRVDALLAATWAEKGVTPVGPADDHEYLRRVYLDLAGRIPTVTESRAFLADPRPDRRQHLVAGLLARPSYAKHFTTIWKHLLMPEADSNVNFQFFTTGFEAWLRQQFDKNAPYDAMVRELLSTSLGGENGRNGFDFRRVNEPSPLAYYLGKEGKPENLASATARVFLGIRLECAQCHDHPFAEWKRDQFWGLASFFAGIKVQDNGNGFAFPEKEILDRRELPIPGTDRVVQATFPDGSEPTWKFKVGPRQTLADWVTAKENPYFAKAVVNRVWAHFFGVGLVEPVDEMAGGQDITVYHAGVLDELARAFVAHKYDLKFLCEAIANTRAYNLTSRGRGDTPLFARHPLRGLTGEQLFDSLAVATGQANAIADDPFGQFTGNGNARAEFLVKFGPQPGKTTEYETSIIHALTLMNGRFVADATSPSRSELLTAVIEAPFLNDKSRVEAIYLATVSRMPQQQELDRAVGFLVQAGKGKDAKKARDEATADIFWALLNSAEFVFNH